MCPWIALPMHCVFRRRMRPSAIEQLSSAPALCPRHLQPPDRALAGAERVGLDAQALEHGDVEVAEVLVLLLVERDVLAVAEAAAGDDAGHVLVAVARRVAEVGAVVD